MFDRERAEMAAGFARVLLRDHPLKISPDTMAHGAMERLGSNAVDIGLQMADRIIAACTKAADAVVGDGNEAAL